MDIKKLYCVVYDDNSEEKRIELESKEEAKLNFDYIVEKAVEEKNCDYVVLEEVETDFEDYEDIEILDEWNRD